MTSIYATPRFSLWTNAISWLLGILLCSSYAFSADFTGPVVRVLDGDTIEVSRSHRNVRIRLNGIDAPEKGQAYGHTSGEFVALQAFGKDVTVQTYGLDKYGRTIGDVYLPDGTLLNKELVKAGLAWWYCKYSADQSLAQLEIEARETKRGLWQDPKPVPPWVFRKRQRGQSVSRDEMSCFPPMPRPLEGVQVPPEPGPQELVTLPVVGNKCSGKYHLPHCSGYSQINLENRVEFTSEAEAEAAGYRRAGNCP
jgi:endonuclease YncB( thermonuclease family)